MIRTLPIAVAALAVAAPASALTIVNNTAQVSAADLNKSFTVRTDGSTSNSDGLFATLVFKLTKVTATGTGTKFEFSYSVTNASVAPAANSRLGQFGFDITGTPGAGLTLSSGATDYFKLPGNNNGNFNGLGHREICMNAASSSNCNGGANDGILSGLANSKIGKLVFTYANSTQSVTFSNFATRWQAGQNGSSASGPGVSITSVPEPATWAMMIGGFGLLGAAVRRQRRTAAAVA
ncbi:MAG TPA: cistern family PEP-CTERM protein [Sphingomonas sp.]|nr:cistern family PEP-CTERM protein [Sphingomonas sp.]